MNKILTIPSHLDFTIPVYFKDEIQKSYLKQMEGRFKRMLVFLKNCEEKNYAPTIKKDVIDNVQQVQYNIINVIKEYFKGHPSIAYELFENTISKNDLDHELISIQQTLLPQNSYFFRVQKNRDKVISRVTKKKPLDLFHPPFQRRRSVASNRFSISGYPSLYLSQNLHASYSECFPADNFGPFHAICFKNIRPLYFIDLSEEKLFPNNKLFEGLFPSSKKLNNPAKDATGLIDILKVYQLVVASHTKINYVEQYPNETFHFKAEYIIPQLILQWLKTKDLTVDGIKYKSCTGSSKFSMINNHYNYVLPVKSNLDKGFCPSLKSLFSSSQVYSYFDDVSKDSDNILNRISKELRDSDFTPLFK